MKRIWLSVPTIGIFVYAILYVISTLYYPGGSSFDRVHPGFDWIHNYWCDLTSEIALNGHINRARPVALTAMSVLCSSLLVFWYNMPVLITNKVHAMIIRYAGMLSMLIAMFLFTYWHDTVINLSGLFGIPALILTFAGLYKTSITGWFSMAWYASSPCWSTILFTKPKFSCFFCRLCKKSRLCCSSRGWYL